MNDTEIGTHFHLLFGILSRGVPFINFHSGCRSCLLDLRPCPFASDLWAASTWQAQFLKGPTAPYGGRIVDSYIHRPAFELFDLTNDPAESKNLAADARHAGLLDRMKQHLKAFHSRTGDPWLLKWKYE